MNLHGMVRSVVTAVNPDISVTLSRSTGYTTGSDGKQAPTFATLSGLAQVQPVAGGMLRHTDALNITGTLRCVRLLGNWAGVVRTDQKGGDVMQFPQIPGGAVQSWKVATVLETWPDWSSVVVVLQ